MEHLKVQDLISQLSEEGMKQSEIADELGVSQPMISQYKKGFNASLDVALKMYQEKDLVLFPFGEYALKELSK